MNTTNPIMEPLTQLAELYAQYCTEKRALTIARTELINETVRLYIDGATMFHIVAAGGIYQSLNRKTHPIPLNPPPVSFTEIKTYREEYDHAHENFTHTKNTLSELLYRIALSGVPRKKIISVTKISPRDIQILLQHHRNRIASLRGGKSLSEERRKVLATGQLPISEYITEQRNAGVTITTLAKQLGCSPSWISKLTIKPPVEAQKIAPLPKEII